MRKIFIYVLANFLVIKATGQNANLQLVNPLPVSPTAAAIMKYGEIPVSKNTGIPNISIPIYEVKIGDISFPISLSYHASGIKVEDVASNVGLGWSLAYGGSVSRQVRGLPDESAFGYNGDVTRYINGQMNSSEIQSFLSSMRAGQMDGEKDLYFFSLPGNVSGKFFLDSFDTKYVTFPVSNLRIEKINIGGVNYWKITDDKGLQYFFTQTEFTQTENYSSTNNGGFINTTSFEGVSTWLLTKIADTKGNKVEFIYGGTGGNYQTIASETQSVLISSVGTLSPTDCQESSTYSYSQNMTGAAHIKNIIWRGGSVVFNYLSNSRSDLLADTALSKIIILNNQGDTAKQFQLFTSYFLNGSHTDTTLNKRLRLDSLKEISAGKKLPPYSFEYNSTGMTHRLSYNQDYWGYYNGKSNSKFVTYYKKNYYGEPVRYGADKTVDPNYTQANMLQKIKYPTGGYTEFEFENNKYRLWKDTFYTYNSIPFVSRFAENSGGEQNQYLFNWHDSFSVTASDTGCNGRAAILIRKIASCDNPNNNVCFITITISGDTTFSIINPRYTVFLPIGNYVLNITIETEFAHIPYASAAVDLYLGECNLPGYYDDYGGGLRIKKMINNDGIGIAGIREYKYNSPNKNYSSGTIGFNNNLPGYEEDVVNHHRLPYGSGTYDITCNMTRYSSSSNYPLLTSNGGYVTYENVEEFQKSSTGKANGKTEYQFTTFETHPDLINTASPFPPASSFEWKRGLLLREKVYSVGSDSIFTLIQEKKYNYTFLENLADTTRRVINNFKVSQRENWDDEMATTSTLNAGLNTAVYKTVAEVYYLSSDTIIVYDINNSSNKLALTNAYVYKPSPLLLDYQTTFNSKGETKKVKYRYPTDFGNYGFISTMISSNILNSPIETISSKINLSTQEEVLGGVIVKYKSSKILPEFGYKFLLANPILISNYQLAAMDNTGSFSMDSRYNTLVNFTKYDTVGNIIEQKKENDFLNSYIWDYNNTVPIAEVKNADSTSIGYTSFESDGKGNWSYSGTVSTDASALTGKKVYSLSTGNITKAGLQSGTYIISYWSKNGSFSVNSNSGTSGQTVGGWTYYEHKITNPSSGTITITGAGTIDEVRLYPETAQMTTYVYKPLIGIITSCSANNFITRYEYDAFNRLSLVRDANNNILKKVCYNLLGQVDDCSLPTTTSSSQSVTITSTNLPGVSGFGVSFINTTTSQTYSFNIPSATSIQTLGTIPSGIYQVTIYKPGNFLEFGFYSGCGTWIYNTSATFENVSISSSSCNSITIDWAF